ncbi:Zinc finger CCCH domain-containing protein 22 [Striga hermonthica]|uniref:Zinc finger CCCH domain-containing protein 22 n=1 Tax=Striga hermonthica TaxID=68872 RepID=A0A9N7N3J3_STRHE|nr:Zinc finger CCCH domain-containing protein 22 [Striga hermonthica]
MADEEDERVLEQQLHFQLNEQKESLAAVADALAVDTSNPELLSIHLELVQSIKEAEEGLFHLKKARLLREADSILEDSVSVDVKLEPLDPMSAEAEPLAYESFSVGSKCRFRHTNGRWYDGQVVGLEGSESAKISFLTPTSESMLMCKFFLQKRCRFGSSCRLSHGIDVPLSSLKTYKSTTWEQTLVGSTVWAVPDPKGSGIWREAELESWDDELKTGQVIFRDDGTSKNLEAESIALSEYAEVSGGEEEETDTSSDLLDSSEYEEEDDDSWQQGLGFIESTNLRRGVQTETAIFAKWENHTRGIASKMMASMGYREGMGLGASGQGIVDPIPVKVLPPKQSLDYVVKNNNKKISENKEMGVKKKRTRGGKRIRDKKLAANVNAAQDEEDSKDVFSLINSQLAAHGRSLVGGGSERKRKNEVDEDVFKKEDRRALLAREDEVKNLRAQADRLEEMAQRNRKEKVVHDAAMRKLNEVRKALAGAEAARASTSNAVSRKEKEKKWLKF